MNSHNTSLTLGSVCLDQFIEKPEELSEEKKKEMGELIKKIENNSFNNEKLPLNLLKIKEAGYLILKPEFLSMHSISEYKGKKIWFPRFSVYKKNDKEFSNFSIDIVWADGYRTFHKPLFFQINNENKNHLPWTLEKHLLKTPEFSGFKMQEGAYMASRELWNKYRKLAGDCSDRTIRFVSRFCGIIPDEIKGKIEESETIFENQLHIITETKPREWATPNVSKDLLLIGILEDTCYLIDQFKTTSIENYVKSEFTE